jgi:hypothetical protein
MTTIPKAVWKYPVPIQDQFVIVMAKGAKPLCVQLQKDTPTMWTEVDPYGTASNQMFKLLGTGHIRELADTDKYVGTFQLLDGDLVFHLYHCGEQRA